MLGLFVVGARWSEVSPSLIVCAIGISCLYLLARTDGLFLTMRICGIETRRRHCFRVFCEGVFVEGLTWPGKIWADSLRAFRIGETRPDRRVLLALVHWRVVGSGAALAAACLGLLLSGVDHRRGGVCAALAAALLLMRLGGRKSIPVFAAGLLSAGLDAAMIGLLSNGILGLNGWTIACMMPTVMCVAALSGLPLGLGIWEGGLIALLMRDGTVSLQEALSVALLCRTCGPGLTFAMGAFSLLEWGPRRVGALLNRDHNVLVDLGLPQRSVE